MTVTVKHIEKVPIKNPLRLPLNYDTIIPMTPMIFLVTKICQYSQLNKLLATKVHIFIAS